MKKLLIIGNGTLGRLIGRTANLDGYDVYHTTSRDYRVEGNVLKLEHNNTESLAQVLQTTEADHMIICVAPIWENRQSPWLACAETVVNTRGSEKLKKVVFVSSTKVIHSPDHEVSKNILAAEKTLTDGLDRFGATVSTVRLGMLYDGYKPTIPNILTTEVNQAATGIISILSSNVLALDNRYTIATFNSEF